ncbi:MAG: glycine-rich domain-containing protein [Lutibacter sp.]
MVENYPTLKNLVSLFLFLFSITAFSQSPYVDNTPNGTETFIVPLGVTQITVEVWGGGGRGGKAATYKGDYAGGGGGAYSRSVFNVVSGNTYTYNVGEGSVSLNAGGDSWFINNTTILAKGGNSVPNDGTTGALGGSASLYGDVKYYGGNGADKTSTSGGGGSSAGSASNGTNATNFAGATAPLGGGNGGDGKTGSNGAGVVGYVPGGGGGGAASNNFVYDGGAGGNGQVKITWVVCVNPSAPTVGTITQPTCAIVTGSVILSGLPAGNWTLTRSPGNVTTTGNTTSITISGLSANTYTYTVTNASNCTSTASANVVINAQPATPTAPIIGTITQPTCATVTGSVILNGLPSGSWTINPGGINGSGTSTTISGLAANTTYNYTVTSAAGCTSTTSANVVVNAQPSTPTAPTVGTITQPTCATSTGSVVLNGLPATGTWTINPRAITGTGTSTTISGLATGTYNYTVTNATGCTSTVSSDVVINSQPANNVWNGSDDKNWNNPNNWCIGVPTLGIPSTLDVLIPTGLTNYPIIFSGATPGYVENIVFENNTTLNVIDNYLQIKTNLTLNGKIDLEGESQLLQDMGSAFDAASTGTIEIEQQGTGNSFRYNYWSSPVNSNFAAKKYSIGAVLKNGTNPTTPITYGPAYTFADGVVTPQIQLSTYWMYVLRNSGAGYAAWYRVGNTGEILVGEGYTMKGSNTSTAEQNYTFVGKPNNGDITLTLNAGFDYLVGNPYPSALNAYKFLMDNQNTIEGGAIYFWEHYGGDTHNLAGYQAGYATRNLTGGTPATSPSNVSNVVASGVIKKIPGPSIAVGQAFFVVGDADGGNIVFKNSQREFVKESSLDIYGDPYSVFMKSSNTKAKTANTSLADLRPKFRIGFDAPKISHRQILLGIDERATPSVDWGFDAEIYEIFADDMYWMLDGKKYVIQGTNAEGLNSEVPIGIQLSKTGVVTVKIDTLENVDDDTSVYLKDKLTGETFNMREKSVQLNLTAGKYTDRFALIFKTHKLMTEDVKAEVLIPATSQPIIEGIHVFMNNAIGELQIKNNCTEEILSVALINAVGQTVKTWNSNFNIRTISLPISAATGVYLVQINTDKGKMVKKISVE